MKKQNSFIIIVVTVILLFPIVMDKLIGNNISSNISNEQWVSFLGSYVGSILGGVFTIIGVFATIKYYKDQDESKQQERENVILSEIKKQYEIKYKFEFLDELNKMNRTLNIISEHFSTVKMLISNTETENPLKCISPSLWKYIKTQASDIDTNYNNIKSIYECKLSVFYSDSFIVKAQDDVSALYFMLSEGLNNVNKNTSVESLEKDLLDMIHQWHLNRNINDIKDIYAWISDFKQRFVYYMTGFKENM
ncbi:hypothetical protein [Clostridium sp.]|uniref:hypothetical protein n=1 Tax=Clostridium sp. TaxID=1506 RepID=UPI001A619D58|nr:hypothetical protein [Clostridium sp.]MBK5236418.1 hypothetical protein [Clostridium sp.]